MSDAKKTGVVDKLRKLAEENKGEEVIHLKQSDIRATIPKLITHGMMMKAQTKARGKPGQTPNFVIADLCTFDGERLTHDQIASLLPAGDVQQLTTVIFGDAIGEAMDKLMGAGEDDAGSENDAPAHH